LQALIINYLYSLIYTLAKTVATFAPQLFMVLKFGRCWQ